MGRDKQIKDNQYTTSELLRVQKTPEEMTPLKKSQGSITHWSKKYLSQTKCKNERVQNFMSSNKI